MPQSIVQEIDALIQTYEIAVQWQTNDMVVFDNTRFLHGRQGGFDEGRRILTRFGFPRN
jgi:alpha-ketoglutarate-dependent taurine dioxygenase